MGKIFVANMEEVVCFCLQCDAELGTFKNSFNSIGNTYCSPREPSIGYIYGFEVTGDTYQAASGSQVENSLLQDLACKGCKTVLGLRCDSAPEGHMLTKHQLLLRLAHMAVLYPESRLKAVVAVKEKFTLTIPGTKKLSTPRRASSDQLSQTGSTTSLNGFRNVARNMLPPPIPIPNYDSIQRDLNKFKTWAEKSIAHQRADMTRVSDSVERIEKGMKAFRDFMGEVRTDMAIIRQESQTEEDIMDVRSDVNGFRDELATYKQKQDQINSKMTAPDVSKHEFQTLSTDVQDVWQRTAEVDALRTELDYLKTRLDSMEKLIQKPYSIGDDDQLHGINGTVEGLDGEAYDQTHVAEAPQSDQPVYGNGSSQSPHDTPRTVNPSIGELSSNALYPKDMEVIDSQYSSPGLEQLISPKLLVRNSRTTLGPKKPKKPLPGQTATVAGAEPLTTNSKSLEVWNYTGSIHYLALTKVCHLLGLIYPKPGGTLEAKRLLEAHINENHLLDSPIAKQYGTVELVTTGEQSAKGTPKTVPVKKNVPSVKKVVKEKDANQPQRKRKRSDVGEETTPKRGKRAVDEDTVDESPQPVEDLDLSKLTTIDDSFASQEEPPSSGRESETLPAAAVPKKPIPASPNSSTKKLRDSQGNVLTLSGKVDKRSSQYRSRSSLQKPKGPEAPVPTKNAVSTNRESTGSAVSSARPSTVCPLPSLCKAEKEPLFSVLIPNIQAPDPSTLSMETPNMPFLCGVCGKGFIHPVDFRRHKKALGCKDTEYDEMPSDEKEEARKRKLVERERLVVQQLGVK